MQVTSSPQEPREQVCHECGATSSLAWYPPRRRDQRKLVCRECHERNIANHTRAQLYPTELDHIR